MEYDNNLEIFGINYCLNCGEGLQKDSMSRFCDSECRLEYMAMN